MPRGNVEYIISLRDRMSTKLGKINRGTIALDSSMRSLRSSIGITAAAFAAGFAARDIIKVGSTFEQLQISFETMLGSAEKAKELIKDLTTFAIKTPFELQDVSKGAKALLAFGIENEKIIPSLRSLGDVAAGLSVPIGRLILNFGQVKTQGKLTGRELRDFAIAGVPLLNELAKVLGKSTQQVTELVSKGKVGFPEVEKAFQNMSNAGGKFFNLMQKQTASTGGQISNFRDVLALLENDLFKRFQPALNSGIVALQGMIAALRNNIEGIVTTLKVVKQLILTWISYKAIMIGIGIVTRIAALNMVALRAAMISTGIGALAVALGFLINHLLTLKKELSLTEASQLRLNRAFEKADEITGSQVVKLNELVGILNNAAVANWRQKEALSELQSVFPQYFKDLDIEKAKLTDIESLQRKIATGNKLRAVLLEGGTAQSALKKSQDLLQEVRGGDLSVGGQGTVRSRKALREKISEQKKVVFLLKKQARGITDDAKRAEIRDKLASAKSTLTGLVSSGSSSATSSGTTIKSAAPKVFNINIEKLVGEINNNVTNMKEGMAASKEIVIEGLLAALNDTQAKVN